VAGRIDGECVEVVLQVTINAKLLLRPIAIRAMRSGDPGLEQLRQEWVVGHCDGRRSPRHPLFRPLPAQVRPLDGDAPLICGDVIDRSDDGLCLALPSPCSLQPGDALELHVELEGVRERRRARVCWREQTSLIVALGVAYDDS
jgi:hypothetical protein